MCNIYTFPHEVFYKQIMPIQRVCVRTVKDADAK